MSYKRIEQVEWRRFENECLLLNVTNGTYFRINEVASLIWENLDGKTTAEDIIAKITAQFDINESVARQDYRKFITQLLNDHLIIEME
jgi:acyl CoA:acetate/3-ketoacid CoA transferase beta subunit